MIAKRIHHIPDWAWWLVLLAFLFLFLFGGPRPAQGQWTGEGVDYLFPPPEPRGWAETVKVLKAAPGFGQGERAVYTDFQGKDHELTMFRGRFVALFLPDSWLGDNALTPELVRSFLDRTDLVYQSFQDLMGVEPSGEGLLPVAVVPPADTCGWGCGFIASKGVEVADYPNLNPILWREIAAGKPAGVVVHEMTHNFDVFWPYLYYLPEHPHAWTDFVNLYYFLYTREGTVDQTPEEVAHDWLATTAPYFQTPGATWKRCVRDRLCLDQGITPANAWGGLGFRVALAHGPASALGFMEFLRAYREDHAPPVTPEEKEDLYLEALSAGARCNLACWANNLRWTASSELRGRLRESHGLRRDAACLDLDRDGLNGLRGDCDDLRSTVHRGAKEAMGNGWDDDCNGMVDERSVSEAPGWDFPSPKPLPFPFLVRGMAGGDDNAEIFSFRLRSRQRVLVELCSPQTFIGVVNWIDTAGASYGYLWVGEKACARSRTVLPRGRWRADLVPYSAPAPYSFAVNPAAPWPVAPAATVAPPVLRNGAWVLTATGAALPAGSSPTAVRFWVSGQGVLTTVPWAAGVSEVSVAWTPPSIIDPVAMGLSYRVQLLSGEVPFSDWSPAQAFGAGERP